MYVVTGATGLTGRATIAALLARGEKVRAVVHSPDRAKAVAQAGVEVVATDLGQSNGLAAALSGARGVYLLRPPQPHSAGTDVAESFRAALNRSSVERVVALSSNGAHQTEGTGVVLGLHALERVLGRAERPVTFLRAASFLENWLTMIPLARDQGVLPSLLPADLAISTVAVRDVGTAIASLLVDDEATGSADETRRADGTRVVGLDGPREYSSNDVARALSDRFGRPVTVAEVPVDQQASQLESHGVPAAYATEVVALYQGIANGRVIHEANERVLRGTTTLEDWVTQAVAA
jgi:uncharacterized protein YbjT (DUF2867 family)